MSNGVKRSTHSSLSFSWIPIIPQRPLGNPGYLHSPEMGSSSNASPRSVCVPSVPLAAAYAAPAWPLVAVDAFRPVADDTPLASDGTLLALEGILLALNSTLLPAAGALPLVADAPLLALDGPLLPAASTLPLVAEAPSSADDLPPAAKRPVP